MPDASHDFGAHLRQAREQREVSLRQIADRTKISVPALEALERNDISRLPGGIFTRAFVRSYAREVGLDPEDTVRRFVARFPDASAEETPRAYVANPERIEVDEPPTFGRAWRAVAWSMPLLVGVAYFGFGGRLPWWGDTARQPATKVVEPQHPTVPPPPSPHVDPAAPALPIQPDAGTSPVSAIASGSVAAAGAPSAPASQAVPAVSQQAPPPAAAPPAQAATPGEFRLTLSAREACWVSVRVDGASVYSALMRAGERRDLALRGQVSLTVGNAGVFEFLINDRPARPLGGPGQVVTARLNADNLKTFTEAR